MANTFSFDPSNRKKYLFEVLDDNQTKDCDKKGSRYVSCVLVRTDKPSQKFGWSGCLSVEQEIPLNLSFIDEVNFSGNMKLVRDNMGLEYIFVDVWYGFRLERNFEGCILALSGEIKPPVPPDLIKEIDP